MGRLRSNLCHIFGHRRAITIKVFSRSARRLGLGGLRKVRGRMVLHPTGWPLFPPQERPLCFRVRGSTHYSRDLPLPETPQLPHAGPFPCARGRKCQVQVTEFPKNQARIYFILSSDQVPNSLLQKDLPTQNDIFYLDISSLVDISL